ncbi:MAG: hypothetical protein OEV49_04115 [candidate division Zixibacteria bacterium]|nr:hypothetical protein [candidate division Zixibacteria bacterium]MDH3936201.1 hypothetical protein [candidate division Zixibacteria bacterium]MDH4033070.1 hypothetical protein [candidate division Zixibacteria bacterium]
MKRLLLIGTVFCAAALLGFGVTLFMPPDAQATECNHSYPQTVWDCSSGTCNFPLCAKYDCFTVTPCCGEPCQCTFVGCFLKP